MNGKQKKRSRIVALLMVFMMVFSMMPTMAFAEPIDNAPFTVAVDDEEMNNIDLSTLQWINWDGSSMDVTCYTVEVPADATEATLNFDEEKQWSYYDSQGNYIGDGPTSWTASTEHTVAIQDSNGDEELDGISVQVPGAFSAEYFILFVYAEETVEAPFTVTVDDEEMNNISQSTLQWMNWDGSSMDVTCYTVEVPADATEATLNFDEEKQWSYYDSQGTYIGDGPTSWTASTEHTVAIQDSNGDEELDGISVQVPGAFSAEYFILFVYAGAESEHKHSYAKTVTQEPTCYRKGEATFTCSGCKEGDEGHSYTEELDMLEHSYNTEGEVKEAATCYKTGVKIVTCKNSGCTAAAEGHTKEVEIPKTKHAYDEGVVNPEPTCTEGGVKTFTCTTEGCGHSYTETLVKLGHDYNKETGECSRCDDVALPTDEDGTYLISTEKGMLWFAKAVKNGDTAIKGKLIADITLSENWPGIGASGTPFAGSFDGNHKTITLNGSIFGLFINAKGTESKYVEIKNLTTEGSVGTVAIVNTAEYVKIENCINRAEVGGSGDRSYVAGIVGSTPNFKRNCLYITACANEGNVVGKENVAGILANSVNSNAIITKCYNSGTITGTSNVGGIVGSIKGYPASSKIENCYNTGKISGSSKAGGIGGFLWNDVKITNCYNAGEAIYAIAGHLYNNTATITNTYYRGDLCTYSVPNRVENESKLYTGDRGTSVTSAEMSSADVATALGDAFKQSCPSPVFTDQSANGHNVVSGICTVCKQGNNMPVKYKVTFETSDGATVEGDSAYNAGKDYSFKVSIQEGFYAADNFTVCVNSTKVEADENDVYHVEKPNGPICISVTGVKKYEGKVPITRPGVGDGFRVTPCDGYTDVVDSGKDYKFTVTFVDGFKAGNDFAVKVNDEMVTPDEKGVYTLEKPLKPQTITVEGVDAIPGQQTVTIGFDATVGEDKFYVTEETEEMMMDLQVEVPYFDLGLYNLQKFYYNPNCYVDENGNINGQQKAGNRETAYNVVTSMHAFIYITELYYLGYEEDLAGTGYSAHYDSDGDGKTDFEESISWAPGQGVGSSFMNLWDIGTNLNYHLNYSYPLAYEGWGSTSDQQAIEDGDLLSVHRIEGSASGSGYGLFVVNDTNNTYDVTDERDCVTVKQGETVKLTHYLATQGNNYTTAFVTVPNENLYWVEMGAEDFNIKNWERNDFGSMTAATFKTDANGEIMIDTTDIEPGVYYIGANGGFKKGNGQAGSDGFVSQGVESGPAYFKLIIEENLEAAALAKAKEEAKADIESYKNADDYRDAEKAELAAAVEAAKTAIDAAESVEEVEQAAADAKAAMDAIKTDADLKAEEEAAAAAALAQAKEEAKADIESYKNADDYRDAEKAELSAEIEAAKTAIDAAESVEEVEQAVADAKAAMDAIKTDAQLTAEEEAAAAAALAQAKEEAKADIESYKNADAYRDTEKAELAAAVENAKTTIDAAESEEEVAAAVEAAKEAMDSIKTDADLKAEEEAAAAAALAKAKEEAKADIESYKNADDYRDAEKAELAAAVEAAKTAIDAAESEEEVAAAVEAAKEAMDAIKTDADLKAEEEADKEDDSNKDDDYDKEDNQPSDEPSDESFDEEEPPTVPDSPGKLPVEPGRQEDKHTVNIDVDSYEVFSGDVLTVVGNGEFNDFLEVLMDGKVVDSKHYVVKEGSTILTFTSTYLDTLEPGKHTVEMVWKTGRASEEILIVSAEVPAEKEPIDKADTEVPDKEESAKDSEKESENPDTGDMSHPFFYLAVLFMAGAAAVALRRKED